MNRRIASWLAWLLGLLSVALIVASAVLLVLNKPSQIVEGAGVWGTANAPFIFLVIALDFTLVGALVASRRPGKPIGWISLAAGLALALSGLASEYAIYALVSQPGSLSGARIAAWLREWIWVPFVGLIGTFLVLLFPDGHLPSSRWRMVAGLAVVALVFASLSKAFLPGVLEETPGVAIANPLGVEAARELLVLVGTIGFSLAAVLRRFGGFDDRTL
jgi:two-component system, NarL family, sensor kinase